MTTEVVSTYIDMCFAITCVRHPGLHGELARVIPGVQISSSYVVNGRKQDLCIPTLPMIAAYRKEGLVDVRSLRECFTHVNSIFLVSMWAMLVETDKYGQIATEEVVQFFRHVRNGCSHGNEFNFKSLPHRPRWRDKELRMEHSGTRIFPDFLCDADPLLLVVDINNRFFPAIDLPGLLEWAEGS